MPPPPVIRILLPVTLFLMGNPEEKVSKTTISALRSGPSIMPVKPLGTNGDTVTSVAACGIMPVPAVVQLCWPAACRQYRGTTNCITIDLTKHTPGRLGRRDDRSAKRKEIYHTHSGGMIMLALLHARSSSKVGNTALLLAFLGRYAWVPDGLTW